MPGSSMAVWKINLKGTAWNARPFGAFCFNFFSFLKKSVAIAMITLILQLDKHDTQQGGKKQGLPGYLEDY